LSGFRPRIRPLLFIPTSCIHVPFILCIEYTGCTHQIARYATTRSNPIVEVTVNSNEENSSDFCHNYAQEFGPRKYTQHYITPNQTIAGFLWNVLKQHITMYFSIISCLLDLLSEGRADPAVCWGGGMQPPPPPLFGLGEVRICCI
jgi:hypothetical protein